MTTTRYESPLGPLTLLGGPTGLAGLRFPGGGGSLPEAGHQPGAFGAAIEQLEQYFAGERWSFELALDLGGTAFQRTVWEQLRRIPYGTTISYSALTRAIGRPDRIRAVAAAVGRVGGGASLCRPPEPRRRRRKTHDSRKYRD